MFSPISISRTVGMNPAVLQQLLATERRCALQGLYLCIPPDGGFRTPATQEKLWDEGRTVPGDIVTNARDGWNSNHCYGMAFDVVPYTDGTFKALNWKSNTPQFQRMVAIFKEAGFEWGGDWKGNLGDYDHFQMKGLPSSPSPEMIVDWKQAQANGGNLALVWSKAAQGRYAPVRLATA